MMRAVGWLLALALSATAGAHAQAPRALPPVHLWKPFFSFSLDLCAVTGPATTSDPRAVSKDIPGGVVGTPAPVPVPAQVSATVEWPAATAWTLGPRVALATWQTEVETRLGYSAHFTADLGAVGRFWITHRRTRVFVALPLGVSLDLLGAPDRFGQREHVGPGWGPHAGLQVGVVFGASGSAKAGYAQLGFLYRRISRELEYSGENGAAAYDLTMHPMALFAGGGAFLGL